MAFPTAARACTLPTITGEKKVVVVLLTPLLLAPADISPLLAPMGWVDERRLCAAAKALGLGVLDSWCG